MGGMHIVNTGDGSHTVTSRFSGEHYHSTHGAVGESLHVFLRHGLDALGPRAQIRVLEMGFGTGLNALLTRLRARRLEQLIDFVSVESRPLPQSIISQLNYGRTVEGATDDMLAQLHAASWGEVVQLDPFFRLRFDDGPQDTVRAADFEQQAATELRKRLVRYVQPVGVVLAFGWDLAGG